MYFRPKREYGKLNSEVLLYALRTQHSLALISDAGRWDKVSAAKNKREVEYIQ